MTGAIWMLMALQSPPGTVNVDVGDILAGYRAWDISCDGSACSSQASDQVTTITLKRTAGGLAMTLASRRCPEGTPEVREFIPARRLSPGTEKKNNQRAIFVHFRFLALELEALSSCGLAGERAGGRPYEAQLIDRFLKQSDIVAPAAGRRKARP